MKARIKETGHIVEVEDLFDDGTALVNGCYIKVSKLSFIDYIDYEQRRYEIAKAILSGWATDGDGYMNAVNCNTCSLEIVRPYCKRAVEVADMLIAELKKKEDETKDLPSKTARP